jgi:hypothetical protein
MSRLGTFSGGEVAGLPFVDQAGNISCLIRLAVAARIQEAPRARGWVALSLKEIFPQLGSATRAGGTRRWSVKYFHLDRAPHARAGERHESSVP